MKYAPSSSATAGPEPASLPADWPAVVDESPIRRMFSLWDGGMIELVTRRTVAGEWSVWIVLRRPGARSAKVVVEGARSHSRALRAAALAGIEAGFLRST